MKTRVQRQKVYQTLMHDAENLRHSSNTAGEAALSLLAVGMLAVAYELSHANALEAQRQEGAEE